MRDQGSNFCGFSDQDSHHFWDRGSKFRVKILDQLRKNMPRYDPVNCFAVIVAQFGISCDLSSYVESHASLHMENFD